MKRIFGILILLAAALAPAQTITLTLTGNGSTVTTTAAANGAWSFSGLLNGAYTVTPSSSGYTFSPTSQTVTIINGVSVSGVNFTATGITPPTTYSIGGTVSGITGNATVALSGAATASTTTQNGVYSFAGLANGSYTVTPTLSGYTFNPVNQPEVVNDADISQVNFVGTAIPVTTYSLWPSTATPSELIAADPNAVNLGVRFESSEAGYITGIKFYKGGTQNGGTHIGYLWSNTGTLLGSVTFTGETSSGWQTATFATPIAVAANTYYVAAYYAPDGEYSDTYPYFDVTGGTVSGPLTAPEDSSKTLNGVYIYGKAGQFPNSEWNESNYWIDVVFSTTQ